MEFNITDIIIYTNSTHYVIEIMKIDYEYDMNRFYYFVRL